MDSDADDFQPMENLQTAMAEPNESPKKRKQKKKKTVQATIQVLPDRPERAAPIVGYFPSGFDPSASGSDVPTRARVFRSKLRPKRLQVVVSPSGSKVDFVGTNYTGEAQVGQQHCSYALGVLDKETQTLKIVPIASNKIFRLEPKIQGVDSPPVEPESLEDGEAPTRFEKVANLAERYSTNSAARMYKRIKELRREDDAETQKNMDAKIKEVTLNSKALGTTQVHVDRNIPPYNVGATSPHDAYPLDKIILKGEWRFLEDIYQISQEEDVSLEAYPRFISNRFKKLQAIKDEEERKRLAGIFSFITHLIKYKDSHTMDGVSSSAKRHKFPSIISQRFTNLFPTTESKRLSSEKVDLLISYVLVLTLFADEFETDLTDIAKDLKLTSLTLRLHCEQLGCKITRASSMLFATLPLPLQFPTLRRMRKF